MRKSETIVLERSFFSLPAYDTPFVIFAARFQQIPFLLGHSHNVFPWRIRLVARNVDRKVETHTPGRVVGMPRHASGDALAAPNPDR